MRTPFSRSPGLALLSAVATAFTLGCSSAKYSYGGASAPPAPPAETGSYHGAPPGDAAPSPPTVVATSTERSLSVKASRGGFFGRRRSAAPKTTAVTPVAPAGTVREEASGGGTETRRPVQVAQLGTQKNSRQRQPLEPASEPSAASKQIILYAAQFTMAVFEVQPGLKAIEILGRELGGFMVQRDDRQIIIRVPAARFQEGVERLEKVGDVVHRRITADDVTEQYRDLSIRLRNARAVRDRLQQLLARASHVKDALEVERELERLALLIDTIEGQLRFIGDRAAFSTITVVFQPRPRELIAKGTFRLPFPWLNQLGLGRLLRLE